MLASWYLKDDPAYSRWVMCWERLSVRQRESFCRKIAADAKRSAKLPAVWYSVKEGTKMQACDCQRRTHFCYRRKDRCCSVSRFNLKGLGVLHSSCLFSEWPCISVENVGLLKWRSAVAITQLITEVSIGSVSFIVNMHLTWPRVAIFLIAFCLCRYSSLSVQVNRNVAFLNGISFLAPQNKLRAWMENVSRKQMEVIQNYCDKNCSQQRTRWCSTNTT